MVRNIPTYLLYGEDAGKEPDFWLHCETIKSRSSRHRWEIQTHRHEQFFQILYIEAGSGDATFEQEILALKPPCIVTMPPYVDHGFRFSRDIEGLVITILTSHLNHRPGERTQFGDWLARPQLTTLDPGTPDASYLMQTLKRIGEEFDHRQAGRNELLASYVALALRITARLSHQDEANRRPVDESDRRLELLNSLIQRHYRNRKPASFYANELGISLTHLNRITRATTGRTAHDLIVTKLVQESKRDLVFTIASVQEIGLRLGFSDPAYFSRFFLKHVKQTPGVWRLTEKARLADRKDSL